VMSDDSVLTSILKSPSGERHRVVVNTQRIDVNDLAALEVRDESMESSPVLLTGHCCPQQCTPAHDHPSARIGVRIRPDRAHKKSCRVFGRIRNHQR